MVRIFAVLLLSLLVATELSAQEMPPPRRMPRTPVSTEALEDHEGVSSSRQVVGQAIIIDGERLRIGKTEMRLFGIVPPQLSASFGPQARANIDALAGGQNVDCRVRDRDRDGRLLATCTTANGADMALDLLRRGLAVAARGSLVGTELAGSYTAAEQAAQSQKIGLWSLAMAAPPARKADGTPASPVAAASVATPAPAEAEVKPTAQDKKASPATSEMQMQAKVTEDILSQQADADAVEEISRAREPGFLERYQLLVSGVLMLGTALFIVNALNTQRMRDKREEIKALAAALRGELMAARSICLGKSKSIATPADDRTAVWPRIRATLYQAYVGRLGLLGADLARRIASIYGQSADYAALYNPACPPAPGNEVPKKQALEMLIKYIDEVLPRLAAIEQTGRLNALSSPSAPEYKPPVHVPVQYSSEPESTKSTPAAQPSAPSVQHPSAPPAEVNREAPQYYRQQEVQQHYHQQVAQQRSAIEVMSGFWEHTRTFVTNLRSQDASPRPATEPVMEPAMDPNAAEYTAIIEADMERYQREAAIDAAAGRRK